jgi:hypothetical protein
MRMTVNRGGKKLIPKDKLAEASEKLARFEDAEELEDVTAYCLQLNRVAELKQKKEPEVRVYGRTHPSSQVSCLDCRRY